VLSPIPGADLRTRVGELGFHRSRNHDSVKHRVAGTRCGGDLDVVMIIALRRTGRRSDRRLRSGWYPTVRPRVNMKTRAP